MQVRNTTQRWGAVTKLLHWLVVALVIAQFALANAADRLPLGMAKLGLLARHKSVGITILGLALLRLLWRAGQPAPALPASMPRWQRGLAQGSHHLLYALLLLMPLSGWMMSSAKNFPVSWFNLVQLPDLVGASESTYAAMHATHEFLAALLAGTALLHLAGALKHHFVDRDEVLKRMLPFVRALLPLLLLPGALLPAAAAVAAAADAPATGAATPRAHYTLVPARSTLEFRFTQAGAATTGRFTRFTATLDWPATSAPAAAAQGTAAVAAAALVVDIDVGSLDTADRDRDGTLRGADLFAVERFPRAHFIATAIVPGRAAGSWVARGTLRIRDQERQIAVPLTLGFAAGGKRVASLRGETTIRRLDYGVGQGEWKSTEWVGDDVLVRWNLALQETP